MRRLTILASLALAVPAAAQDWRTAPEHEVLLTSYDIEPATLRLKAGEPVRLRFVNNSDRAHRFSADDFFRSARARRRDAGLIADGSIEVPPLSTLTVIVVPQAGRYRMSGGNMLHRLLGMSGRIVVE